ncbi:MAG TPA: hypothetical protein VER17_05255 [Tepidisphaeraceae bacterium]|nr:hypothetical protein [Tepidisphaeraceae bacterium]
MSSSMGDAYILPIYVDPGLGSPNSRGTLPFRRHLEDGLNGANGSNDLGAFLSPTFWTTLIVGAFENYASFDGDADGIARPGAGVPVPGSDAGFDYGISPAQGSVMNISAIFLETIDDFFRQGNFSTTEALTVTHEIGHTVGRIIGHAPTGILREGAPKGETVFDNGTLSIFRKVTQW